MPRRSRPIAIKASVRLRDPQHLYRERLNAQFGIDRVRVLSLEDATGILPQEVRQKALIVLCTTQALRVDKQDTRKVYVGHEGLDATFERLTAVPDMDTDDQGRVLASFVNLCRAWPPLVIVPGCRAAPWRGLPSRDRPRRGRPCVSCPTPRPRPSTDCASASRPISARVCAMPTVRL